MPIPLTLALVLAALLGALAAGSWARWRFARAQPTFRCKLRWPAGIWWSTAGRWPRRRAHAAWAHDVLLVQWGVVWVRTVVLAVYGPGQAVRRTTGLEVRGLGTQPMVLALRLDDGTLVDVAARHTDMCALAGPFVAAVIQELPPAATEPRLPGS